MLPSEIPELPTDPPVRGFLIVWKLLLHDSPGQVSIPNSFASLLVFYILSYLLSKRMGCLSGCLVSFASIQKLFCGICSVFKWSFNEFVGEKVVSLSYSSAILGPPPQGYIFLNHKTYKSQYNVIFSKNAIECEWKLYVITSDHERFNIYKTKFGFCTELYIQCNGFMNIFLYSV